MNSLPLLLPNQRSQQQFVALAGQMRRGEKALCFSRLMVTQSRENGRSAGTYEGVFRKPADKAGEHAPSTLSCRHSDVQALLPTEACGRQIVSRAASFDESSHFGHAARACQHARHCCLPLCQSSLACLTSKLLHLDW